MINDISICGKFLHPPKGNRLTLAFIFSLANTNTIFFQPIPEGSFKSLEEIVELVIEHEIIHHTLRRIGEGETPEGVDGKRPPLGCCSLNYVLDMFWRDEE
jgi:hypothetical protein